MFGAFADDVGNSVSEEKVGFCTLRGPPVARFLSFNNVLAKSPVLALSAPGWVGPGGRNLEILFVALAGDARDSVFEERLGLTSLGDSPVAGVLSLNAFFSKRLVRALKLHHLVEWVHEVGISKFCFEPLRVMQGVQYPKRESG